MFVTMLCDTGAGRPAREGKTGLHAARSRGSEARLEDDISRRRFLKTLGLSGAGMVGLSSYGFAVEAGWPLECHALPRHAGQLAARSEAEIGVIADVHAGGPAMPAERIREIVEQTNALKPDVIVLLGDFAASHKFKTRTVAPEEWAEALGELKAPLGVHAILGNHDWWDDLHAQRTRQGPVIGRRMLEREGIPVYENDVVRLVKDGRPFWLAGLGDQMAFIKRRRKGGRGAGSKASTISTARWPRSPMMRPSSCSRTSPTSSRACRRACRLTLSGHTHGGQVRMFGYSPMVPSRYGNRYAYGHIVEDNRHLDRFRGAWLLDPARPHRRSA